MMIHVDRLSTTLERTPASREISFAIERGECAALVEPARSGPSLLVRILATLIPPRSGRVVIDGIDVMRDPFAARRKLFFADRGLRVVDISAGEYVRLATVSRNRRCDAHEARSVLASVGLAEGVLMETLSAQERRRLDIAAAVLSRADLWLFDEPLLDLDANGRESCGRLVTEGHQRGATIVAAVTNDASLGAACDRVIPL
jgi:ABC-2 type transport system ATP-binding protein